MLVMQERSTMSKEVFFFFFILESIANGLMCETY